jgi:hypothetical protein
MFKECGPCTASIGCGWCPLINQCIIGLFYYHNYEKEMQMDHLQENVKDTPTVYAKTQNAKDIKIAQYHYCK